MADELNYSDQKQFKDWLGLNLHSISWEGRYYKEFEEFWDLLFPANIEVQDQFKKLELINKSILKGPLIAWLKWLKFKLICYLFIYKDYDLRQLSDLTGLSVNDIALALRNFMIERFPYLEEYLNEKFQIGNLLSPNLDIKYASLVEEFDLEGPVEGSVEGEVLPSLEVTLYPDWRKIYDFLVNENMARHKSNKSKSFGSKKNIRRILLEVVVLFLVAFAVIFSIKLINKVYEDNIIEKISLYSPEFDKNIRFEKQGDISQEDLEIKYNELEELERIESRQVFNDITSSQRYEVESDVVLTSVDTLPKNIATANLEQSNYEEVKKGGYRNVRYGRRKAYRVMMTSVDPSTTKKDLIQLLDKYKIEQVDNVKPGTSIPGGIYFNLYVPTAYLKEFMSKVTAKERNATILESKTIYGGPANKNRVFIWVKSI